MLEIKIKKAYYRNKNIIKDVDITLPKFGMYGFFGKNGSGKTTFLRTFTKTVSFEGEIRLNKSILSEKRVAWIPTEPFLYEYLTVKEFCEFYSFTMKENSKQNDFFFDIDNSKLLKDCSTGTKKKAYINAVFQFSNYDIYIFDEPFNGLDIESNYILLNKIIELSKENVVFISSHIIEIVEPYLTEKFFIDDSQVKKIENNSDIISFFKND